MSALIDAGYKLGKVDRPKKVVFCVPVYPKPFKETEAAIAAERELLTAAGWQSDTRWHVGCPYISAARSALLRSAVDADATDIVFVDQDISWAPGAALRLLETDGGIVAGTYRYKDDATEKYMGALMSSPQGRPLTRADGCVDAIWAPAGFLKATRSAVNQMMKAHPELIYGEPLTPGFDLFGHGVMDGDWCGEDVAMCKRWRGLGEKVWIVPDLDITHHAVGKTYPGNLHKFLLRTLATPDFSAKRTAP